MMIPSRTSSITDSPFWGITAFFNPCHYESRLQNYQLFRLASQRQGLPLLTVELAFGDDPFQLSPSDSDILIQRRSRSLMWQKERLLNIALEYLPVRCTNVAWLDSDIIFDNERWIEHAQDKLTGHAVIQLYEQAILLGPNTIFQSGTPSQQRLYHSFAFYESSHKTDIVGYHGCAWAAQRRFIERIRFYDRAVLGGADSIMACAFTRRQIPDLPYIFYKHLSPAMTHHAETWRQETRRMMTARLSYIHGTVFHLWHGAPLRRNYTNRYAHFLPGYDPVRDLVWNDDQCWEWTTRRRERNRLVKKYLLSRREDSA